MNRQTSSVKMTESVELARRHLEAHLHKENAAVAPPPASPRPFTIALSREAGANGALVARAVAERLGWPVYDQELLTRIAEDMGLRTRLVQSVDEKHVSWLQECLQSLSSAPHLTEGAYVRHLVEMMLSLATHGRCVILGRGAAAVLPAATTLRVRLLGPLPDRIAAIRNRLGISSEEARNWIEKTDHERVRFVKEHFQKDPSDPRHYDLVINSARFSVEQCAELIVEALQRLQPAAAPRARPPVRSST